MEVRRLKKEGAYFCWTGPLRATTKMGVEVWARFWEWAEKGGGLKGKKKERS